MNKAWFPWTKFQKAEPGIELHLNLCHLDKINQYPENFIMTNASEHDRDHLEVLVDKTQAAHVADRGYFDYKSLDKLNCDDHLFVTRTKPNTKITILDQIEVADTTVRDGTIISDQQVILVDGINHMVKRFRLVMILTKGQKIPQMVTNLFDVSPDEVTDMCQAR